MVYMCVSKQAVHTLVNHAIAFPDVLFEEGENILGSQDSIRLSVNRDIHNTECIFRAHNHLRAGQAAHTKVPRSCYNNHSTLQT